MFKLSVFKLFSTGLFSIISLALGGFDVAVQLLLIVIFVDYLSGFAVAFCGRSKKSIDGGLNSNIGFIGLSKKILILAFVVIAVFVDRLFVLHDTTRTLIIMFFISNETISIIENARLLGLKVPIKFKNIFKKMGE